MNFFINHKSDNKYERILPKCYSYVDKFLSGRKNCNTKRIEPISYRNKIIKDNDYVFDETGRMVSTRETPKIPIALSDKLAFTNTMLKKVTKLNQFDDNYLLAKKTMRRVLNKAAYDDDYDDSDDEGGDRRYFGDFKTKFPRGNVDRFPLKYGVQDVNKLKSISQEDYNNFQFFDTLEFFKKLKNMNEYFDLKKMVEDFLKKKIDEIYKNNKKKWSLANESTIENITLVLPGLVAQQHFDAFKYILDLGVLYLNSNELLPLLKMKIALEIQFKYTLDNKYIVFREQKPQITGGREPPKKRVQFATPTPFEFFENIEKVKTEFIKKLEKMSGLKDFTQKENNLIEDKFSYISRFANTDNEVEAEFEQLIQDLKQNRRALKLTMELQNKSPELFEEELVIPPKRTSIKIAKSVSKKSKSLSKKSLSKKSISIGLFDREKSVSYNDALFDEIMGQKKSDWLDKID